jgi:hypothetical protein
MIVSTQGNQVVGLGFLHLDPALAVIEVALASWHPAPGKDATRVPVLHLPSLGSERPTSRGSFGNDFSIVGVGNDISPLGFGLALGDLTSDIGDDRSVSTQVPGIVCQLGKRCQVNMDVNQPLALCSLGERMTSEQVQEDVGS